MSKRGFDHEEEYEKEGRGRSENRRHAKTFDALAMKLMALSEGRCAKFPVSEELKLAMKTAQRTKSKAARRRELRHLSGTLRNRPEEAAAIEAVLDGRPVEHSSKGPDLETFREDLASPEDFAEAFDRVCEELPTLDVMLVRELSQELHGEEASARSEAKAYRLLFRELRRAADALEETDEEP